MCESGKLLGQAASLYLVELRICVVLSVFSVQARTQAWAAKEARRRPACLRKDFLIDVPRLKVQSSGDVLCSVLLSLRVIFGLRI